MRDTALRKRFLHASVFLNNHPVIQFLAPEIHASETMIDGLTVVNARGPAVDLEGKLSLTPETASYPCSILGLPRRLPGSLDLVAARRWSSGRSDNERLPYRQGRPVWFHNGE
jgi:hypothetical protein